METSRRTVEDLKIILTALEGTRGQLAAVKIAEAIEILKALETGFVKTKEQNFRNDN
ncbi:MAG: hypothetical protein Pars2KO_18160 [Parasphingorhabdus sp.]